MKLGRKPLDFDLAEVEKLGMLGATHEEMSAWFGCSTRTVERKMANDEGEICRAYKKGLSKLKISLRRQQIECAKKGNVAMLMWLGKQLLEQADKREVKEGATITERTAPLSLTPEDEESS